MQRYFVLKKEKNKFYFTSDDEHHITTVMKMELGTIVEVVYDKVLYHAKLISLNPVVAEELEKIEEQNDNKISVTLAQALVKEQKMDFILQKSTELGIDQIIPIKTTRSVVKVNGKEEQKVKRWEKIVKEASEQSKRISVPKIMNPLSIQELSHLDYDFKILCTVNELSNSLNRVLSNVPSHARILFVVGPEGGFTSEEENTLISQGFISTSLGSRVLRTETVSLYVMSVIQYLFLG